jgi:multiple sugar transport system substrate-binding protein
LAEITLRGMTWQHRRAVDPLAATLPAFRARRPDVDVVWEARSLHGFEFAPVAGLARRCDLIVLDHPFVGEIAASGCLLPLDGLLAGQDDAFVGPSLASYRYAGQIWALPIDAACQVAAYRPDLLDALGEPVPKTWEAGLELGARAARSGLKLAIAFAGVHGLMTFFTLCANLGRPCAAEPDQPLVDAQVARQALEAMRRLLALCPLETLIWNSIALHDAMVARDDLVYCPAVYGYATYAEDDLRRPLRFADLAGLGRRQPWGSTIGGTGLGISATTQHPEGARAYAAFLADPRTQREFALHHGQPARVEVWEDRAIGRRFGGYFSATRASIERAWTRPRYPGYLQIQAKAGALVEAYLRGEVSERALVGVLQDLHAARAGEGAL